MYEAHMRNPFLKSYRWFLELVPPDGCLIVFNGKRQCWHSVMSNYFGDLQLRTLNPFNFIENTYKNKNIRDLYITYKDQT